MSAHDTPPPDRTIAAADCPIGPGSESLRAGHETTDVRPGGILALAGALAVLTLGAQVLLIALVQLFSAQASKQDPVASPLASQPLAVPEPHLQDAPTADYRSYRARQDKLLISYGWADESHTAARIPVERAMQLILERGLPRTSNGAAGADSGESAAEGAEPSVSPRKPQVPQNEQKPPARGD